MYLIVIAGSEARANLGFVVSNIEPMEEFFGCHEKPNVRREPRAVFGASVPQRCWVAGPDLLAIAVPT
jgi:hypothetical protein